LIILRKMMLGVVTLSFVPLATRLEWKALKLEVVVVARANVEAPGTSLLL
jgi:hypothetical protein